MDSLDSSMCFLCVQETVKVLDRFWWNAACWACHWLEMFWFWAFMASEKGPTNWQNDPGWCYNRATKFFTIACQYQGQVPTWSTPNQGVVPWSQNFWCPQFPCFNMLIYSHAIEFGIMNQHRCQWIPGVDVTVCQRGRAYRNHVLKHKQYNPNRANDLGSVPLCGGVHPHNLNFSVLPTSMHKRFHLELQNLVGWPIRARPRICMVGWPTSHVRWQGPRPQTFFTPTLFFEAWLIDLRNLAQHLITAR